MQLVELVKYLNGYLNVREVPDSGPMGLQVEGRKEVNKVVTGVSANLALFEEAVARKADAIIVHHGLLWDRDSRVISGLFKRRLQFLLQHDLSLLAYHLALDRHEKIGNNFLAAKALAVKNIQPLGDIGVQGEIKPLRIEALAERVRDLFRHPVLSFGYGPEFIRRVGFCSGGAARDVYLAIDAKLDAFITGEAAEPTMQIAREAGIHFIAAGHHATEKLGIIALGRHIEKKFHIKVEFVDIENPI